MKNQGDLKNALYYSDLWGEALAEDNDKDIRNPKISILSNYLENKITDREKELTEKRMWIFSLGIISCLLIILIFVIIKLNSYRHRARQTEINYLQTIINDLNLELKRDNISSSDEPEIKNSAEGNLKRENQKDILMHYAQLIDYVCKFLYLKKTDDGSYRQISEFKNIRQFLTVINDGQLIEHLKRYVDAYNDNWVSNLSNICPSLNSKESTILLCEHLGISSESIQILLNYTKQSMYNARSAAKRKLQNAGLTNSEIQTLLSPLK